ncbi:MAG: GTPase Era [Bacteroidetes bacterium]|nr:MAG: GTPase Era [Bacteroidota bacterium]
MQKPDEYRCGYVALIGKPNVGKSTLLNALLGQKLSIVTKKPQTTRNRVLGILTDGNLQIILLDTPGVINPRYGLQRSMMKDVKRALGDADLVLFLADAGTDRIDSKTLEYLSAIPTILVLNKMDLVETGSMLPRVERYLEEHNFEEVIPISALKKKNLDVLLNAIRERMPLGPQMYPEEMISEHPERFFVAEMIREKIFIMLRQEVPYATQVDIIGFEEREGEKDLIYADIIVERQSQKGILIGKKGATLKKIGSAARVDIEEFLDRPVFLKLHVKVRDDWRNRDAMLRSFGFET